MMMTISFTGLASGFDSASYIDAIMAQEKLPLKRLETKKQVTTAYQNVFKSLNTKLSTLKDAATALSDLNSFQVFKASSSDTTKLSVTADSSAMGGEYSVNVTQLAQKHVVASQSFDASAEFKYANFSNTLKIGEYTTTDGNGDPVTTDSIDLTKLQLEGKTVGEALNLIASHINSLTDGKVQASVIQTEDGKRSLVLTSKQSGAANKIDYETTSNWLFSEKQEALDAKITVNGIEIVSSTNTIKDAIPGVTLTLSNKGLSTVNVSQDVDTITGKVEAFVKAYNDIINTIKENTQKSTKNSDGSLSLTLQGDSTMRSLRNQLADMMNAVVGDTKGFKLLSDIGLEVDKGVTSASLMTGTITFDKELFKQKLQQNPAEVEKMFTSEAVANEDNTVTGQDGIGTMFKKVMKAWTDSVEGIITSKIKGYDSEISYLTEQIQSMNDRLEIKEASLKTKFVNLEVVMSTLNSQSDWISSQLTALTKSTSSSS
jgi:flagellar hook-associated protein 2